MKKNMEKEVKGLIPNLAKKIGERSVDATCMWWHHQPVVPESMKKQK